MRTSLVLEALQRAILLRDKVIQGVILHIRLREPIHRSSESWNLCEQNGIIRSKGKTGSCYDRATSKVVLVDTVDREYLYRHVFEGMSELRAGIRIYMNFYNHKRRYLQIGNISPIGYELTLLESASAA